MNIFISCSIYSILQTKTKTKSEKEASNKDAGLNCVSTLILKTEIYQRSLECFRGKRLLHLTHVQIKSGVGNHPVDSIHSFIKVNARFAIYTVVQKFGVDKIV